MTVIVDSPRPAANSANPAPVNTAARFAELPIVPHYEVAVGVAERRRLARLAEDLRAAHPDVSAVAAFGPQVRSGLSPWPSLVIEDHSWIALFEQSGDIAYSYRALLLAGEGDLVAIGESRSPAFEAYCRDGLGLGAVHILMPRRMRAPRPLAVRCASDDRFLDRAAATAEASGGLNVVPYMGTGGVWMLASRLAELGRVPVHVAAPPPGLTRRVNDKLWFAARVNEVLGHRAAPPARAVYNLASLAGCATTLAKRCRSVAVKIPASASSAGNIILDSREIRDRSLKQLRDRVKLLLAAVGWRGGYPLMVTAWEQPVIASPSAQLWIPARGDGDPMVEAIFDQATAGTAAVFSGAAPSSLPDAWLQRLAGEAVRLGCLFQDLGYFGRCSFDSILVGESQEAAELHWVECNGRWGGVSIPMTLVNRLVGDWMQRPFVIIERSDLARPPRDLAEILASLKDDLYRPGIRESGVVVLSPGRLAAGTGFEIMVLGDSVAAARAKADELAPRLTGLAG